LVNLNKNHSTKPLKKSKLGFEIECHIIDKEGYPQNRSPDILKAVKEKDETVPIIQECGNNFFELTTIPSVQTYNPALHLIDSLEKVHQIIDEMGLMIYPFGTYPQKFPILYGTKETYNLQKKIFGEKFDLLPNSAGFHCHYSLPKGVFDEKKKNLRLMIDSKLTRSFVSSYNFSIAADPAMTLFAQSSPFFDGKNVSKDMKNLLYRGGVKLKFKDGVYTKHQMFANLQPYKHTMTDVMELVQKRWKRWRLLARKADPKADINKIYPSPLDISWNPVKINKVGTLEHRSMDTNFLSISLAIAVLFKFNLKTIQREFIEVMPADFAIKEPFKMENSILYIPPHSYLRNKLQYWSIYKGHAKKEVREYVKRFLKFSRANMPKKYKKVIQPVVDMVENSKSMSDKILDHAKYKGYFDGETINKEDSAKLALYYAKQFPKDLEKTKKNLERVASI